MKLLPTNENIFNQTFASEASKSLELMMASCNGSRSSTSNLLDSEWFHQP